MAETADMTVAMWQFVYGRQQQQIVNQTFFFMQRCQGALIFELHDCVPFLQVLIKHYDSSFSKMSEASSVIIAPNVYEETLNQETLCDCSSQGLEVVPKIKNNLLSVSAFVVSK